MIQFVVFHPKILLVKLLLIKKITMRWLLFFCVIIITGCTSSQDVPIKQPGDITDITSSVSVVWDQLQPAADTESEQWNWSYLDAQLEGNGEHQVMVIWPYALWDQVICHADVPLVLTLDTHWHHTPYIPCSQEFYEQFVRELVAHYPHVRYWQLMETPEEQEPPMASFIGTNTAYQEVLGVTSTIVHANNSENMMVAGTIGEMNSETLTFWAPLFEQGLSGVDVLSVRIPKEQTWEVYESLFARYHLDQLVWARYTP